MQWWRATNCAKGKALAAEIALSAPLAVTYAKRVIDEAAEIDRGLQLEAWAQAHLAGANTLNQAFLALAIGAGATCAITDPIKLGATIRAADLIRERDNYAKAYIKYCRSHPVEEK
jgi:hypothetical protein